jgi:fibrillarin-like rRNA methylase
MSSFYGLIILLGGERSRSWLPYRKERLRLLLPGIEVVAIVVKVVVFYLGSAFVATAAAVAASASSSATRHRESRQ